GRMFISGAKITAHLNGAPGASPGPDAAAPRCLCGRIHNRSPAWDHPESPGNTMASALSERLSRIVKEMRGQARITESNVSDMLREVRMALLEADVALPVVRDFIARVKDKALGQDVVGSLTPGQALVGIVNRELAATMGEGIADINLAAQPPAVI